MAHYIRQTTIFATAAFLLNFLWESWHAVYLYQGHGLDTKEYVNMIGYVSLVDMLLLLGVFVVGGVMWKQFFWYRKMGRLKYAYIIVSSVLVAILIEVKGVYVLNQWSYNELMPTIFGLGLSPLLQLAVTGLLSIWFVGKIV